MSCQCVRAATTWSNWSSVTPTGSAEICVFVWVLLQDEFFEICSRTFKSAGKFFLLGGSQQLHNPHNEIDSMFFWFLRASLNQVKSTWNRSCPHCDRQNHTWDLNTWWFSLKIDFSCGDRSCVASTTKNNEIPINSDWFTCIYCNLEVLFRSNGKI